jgi:hypothetical protein
VTSRGVFTVVLATVLASACSSTLMSLHLYEGRPKPKSATAAVRATNVLQIDEFVDLSSCVRSGNDTTETCRAYKGRADVPWVWYRVLPGPHRLVVSYYRSVSGTLTKSNVPLSIDFAAEAGHEYQLQSFDLPQVGVWLMLFDQTSGLCVSPDTTWTRRTPPPAQCFPPDTSNLRRR